VLCMLCAVYGAANEAVVMRRAVRQYNRIYNKHLLGDGAAFCGMTPCRLVHI